MLKFTKAIKKIIIHKFHNIKRQHGYLNCKYVLRNWNLVLRNKELVRQSSIELLIYNFLLTKTRTCASYAAPTPLQKVVSMSMSVSDTCTDIVITVDLFIFFNYYQCHRVSVGVVFGVSVLHSVEASTRKINRKAEE